MPSPTQAPLTEQCRQETSSEEWLIRLLMQINLESHQRLPRPTSWWRKRSSQSLTFHNSSNHCQSNSLTCGLLSTWMMTSLRESSSSLEKSTQSLRTRPHQFPISIVYSQEDRLMAFLDSIKWFLRHRKLTELNLLRAQGSRNREKSILTIWVKWFLDRRRCSASTPLWLTRRITNNNSCVDNHTISLLMLSSSNQLGLLIKLPWEDCSQMTEPRLLITNEAPAVLAVSSQTQWQWQGPLWESLDSLMTLEERRRQSSTTQAMTGWSKIIEQDVIHKKTNIDSIQ